jgi:GNAT superfamily N-acetyltransferase
MIVEVSNKDSKRLFHQVPFHLYAEDKNYIAPLQHEVEGVFDDTVNKVLLEGSAKRFVLTDENDQPIGRIAAFVDHKRNKIQDYNLGGIGFFECIDNSQAASTLFETAFNYLKEFDIDVVEGPVNFGERDRFWGLLVDGFFPPLYQENYNPPYYQRLFEENGFQPFEQVITFKGISKKIPFDRMKAVARRIRERYPISIKTLDYSQIDQFAEDFVTVYNASFSKFDHFKPLLTHQIIAFLEQARPIIDKELACIAYFDGQPAGFIALYPDINPFLKFAKGQLNSWTAPIFLLKKKFTRQFAAKGMGFGIHPEFQSKGIFALLLDHLSTPRNVRLYPEMYLAGIRAHNKEIISMYSKMEVEKNRVHLTYRKHFNLAIPFEPFEFIY